MCSSDLINFNIPTSLVLGNDNAASDYACGLFCNIGIMGREFAGIVPVSTNISNRGRGRHGITTKLYR